MDLIIYSPVGRDNFSVSVTLVTNFFLAVILSFNDFCLSQSGACGGGYYFNPEF